MGHFSGFNQGQGLFYALICSFSLGFALLFTGSFNGFKNIPGGVGLHRHQGSPIPTFIIFVFWLRSRGVRVHVGGGVQPSSYDALVIYTKRLVFLPTPISLSSFLDTWYLKESDWKAFTSTIPSL